MSDPDPFDRKWGGRRQGPRRREQREWPARAQPKRGGWHRSGWYPRPPERDPEHGLGYGNRGRFPREDWFRDQVEESFRGVGPRGYRRPDERILDDVCERLTVDPYVDASEIEVEVRDGEVSLTGTVHSRSAKRLAEDLAESAPGVRDVQNRLRIAR